MRLGLVEQTPAAAQSGGELEGEGAGPAGGRTLWSGAVGGRRGGQPTLEWGGVARAGSSSQVSLPVRPVGSGARLVSSNRTARREGQTGGRATQVDATAQCNGSWWAERDRDGRGIETDRQMVRTRHAVGQTAGTEHGTKARQGSQDPWRSSQSPWPRPWRKETPRR